MADRASGISLNMASKGSATLAFVAVAFSARASIQIQAMNSGVRWHKAEFRISGVPAASNPLDPEVIVLDATFRGPSGIAQTVPAFWFQDYTRVWQNGVLALSPKGNPEWRLR